MSTDNDGNPITGEDHNYITIRGYYNGPTMQWVSKQEGALLPPVDLAVRRSAKRSSMNRKAEAPGECHCAAEEAGYDGSLLKPNDLLLAVDAKGAIMKDKIRRARCHHLQF